MEGLTLPPSRQPEYYFQRLGEDKEVLVVRGVILDRIARVLPKSGYLNFSTTDAYTENGGHGVALNIDRKRLPHIENDSAWPLDSSRLDLHLVRPGDLICSIAPDEAFLHGKAGKIRFGLFVLRESQDQQRQPVSAEPQTYTVISPFDVFDPDNKRSAVQALSRDHLQDIIIV